MTRDPPHKARVIALIRQGGKSLTQIAHDCGVSKNVVVGYRNRLRAAGEALPKLDQPEALRLASIARIGKPAPKVAPPASRPDRSLGGGMRPPETASVIPFPRSAEPARAPLALPQHSRPRACRWPLWGDRERPTHQYCDAPRRDPGCSWCAQHAAIAFMRWAPPA